MDQKKRPSGWLYLVAAVIPLLGCLMAAALVYAWFPGLPGTLESRIKIDDLTQVVVPGSQEIMFPESGAYAVYYEYRSVVGGTAYRGSERPPTLACTLTSRASGDEVAVVPDRVPGDTYSTRGRTRVGTLVGSITIKKPGSYRFACEYPDGRSSPKVVLAVGPNLAWEFLGIAARTVLAVAAGLAVLVGCGLLAAVVVMVVALGRRRPRARGFDQSSGL